MHVPLPVVATQLLPLQTSKHTSPPVSTFTCCTPATPSPLHPTPALPPQRDLSKASSARQPKSQDAAAQQQQRRSDLQQARDTAARKLRESTAQAAQQQQNVARRQRVLAQLQLLQQHLQAQIAKLEGSVPWAFEVQREPYMPSYGFGPDPTVLAALAASNYGNAGRAGAGNGAASATSSSGSAASAGGS